MPDKDALELSADIQPMRENLILYYNESGMVISREITELSFRVIGSDVVHYIKWKITKV
jgi:hypothetical protein